MRLDHEENERRIIEAIREGDEKALETLYYASATQLHAFVAGFLGSADAASEVVSNVFVRIWQHRESWEPRGSLRSYLYGAVRNEALSHLRSRRRHASRTLALSSVTVDLEDDATADGALEAEELSESIWNIVDDMPPNRRAAFTLHRRYGLTYEEIAAVLETTPKAVENHIGRALKYLRDRLFRDIS